MAGARQDSLAGRVLVSLQAYFQRRLETLFANTEEEIARDEFMRPHIVPPSDARAGQPAQKH